MAGILLMALAGGIIIFTPLGWLWRLISHMMAGVGLFLLILAVIAVMFVAFGYAYF